MSESLEHMPRFTHTIYDFSIVLSSLKPHEYDFSHWCLERIRTSDGWEENAEEHQKAVSAAHDCDCGWRCGNYESGSTRATVGYSTEVELLKLRLSPDSEHKTIHDVHVRGGTSWRSI